MAQQQAPPPADSHYDLSQAYWSIRMRDDEKIDGFIARVKHLEDRIGYSMKPGPGYLNHQPTIDLWLTRISPRILDRLKRETRQRMDFETEGQLFDVIRKIEFKDRVEAARRYQNVRIHREETFREFQARMAAMQRELGYDASDSASENRLIDAWLLRLSRAHREKVRRYTNGLEDVETEEQLLEVLRALDHVEDGQTAYAPRAGGRDEERDPQDGSGNDSDGDGAEDGDENGDEEAGAVDDDDDPEQDDDGQASDEYQSSEEQQELDESEEITQDDVKLEEYEAPCQYVVEYQQENRVQVKQEDDLDCEVVADVQEESATPGAEDEQHQNHVDTAMRTDVSEDESDESFQEDEEGAHEEQGEQSTANAHQSGKKKRKQTSPSSVRSKQSRQAWSALQERRKRLRRD